MFKCNLCGYEGKSNIHLCLDAPSLRKYYTAKLKQCNIQIADLKQQIQHEKVNTMKEKDLFWARLLEYLRNKTSLNGQEIMKLQRELHNNA